MPRTSSPYEAPEIHLRPTPRIQPSEEKYLPRTSEDRYAEKNLEKSSDCTDSSIREWQATDKLAKPVVMPGKFDGTGHLSEYLAHFDLCRQANGWNHELAGVFLGLSLTGIARRLLSGIETNTAVGYLKLREALVQRFQPPNQSAMYKALLKKKERVAGECLQAHSEEIERFTRLAYPEADITTINVMAKDRFVDSLQDNQLQCWVHQSQPKTLMDAVQSALHAEACLRPNVTVQTARAAGPTMAEELARLTASVEKDRSQRAGEYKSRDTSSRPRTSGGGGRPPPNEPRRCYYCAQEGHFRHECPEWLAKMKSVDDKKSAPAAPTSGN